MKMFKPPHPGLILKELCIDPLGLSLTEVARALKISRKTLSEIVNGRAGITTNMALRLALAFNTTPESWLEAQMQYDIWKEKRVAKGSLMVVKLAA